MRPFERVEDWAEPEPRPETKTHQARNPGFELEAFIAAHLSVRRGPIPWDDTGRKWELETCPFNPDHTGGSAVVLQSAAGNTSFKCHHQSCSDQKWRHVRELFDGPRPNGGTGTSSEGPRIRSIDDIQSIRNYANQKIDFVVDGLMAAGTVTAITGDSGAGKSSLASFLCRAVSVGGSFAGRTAKKGPALILDRENPLGAVCDRFDRLGLQDSSDFKIWGGWEYEQAAAPNSPIVLEWIARRNPKPVIVVDSFIAFHDGSEDDSADMRKTLQGFRHLANLGATVIVLHHSGKGDSTKDYRGSSDFKAGLDVGYVQTNLSADPSRLDTLRLRTFKARFRVESELIIHWRNGQFEADDRGPALTTNELLRDLLISNAGATVVEFEALAVDKKLGRKQARNFIANGAMAGTIFITKGQRNTKRFTWVGEQGPPIS